MQPLEVQPLYAHTVTEEMVPHLSKGRRQGDGGQILTAWEELTADPLQRRSLEVYPLYPPTVTEERIPYLSEGWREGDCSQILTA